MKIKKIIFLIFSIFFIGCSTKNISVDVSPLCEFPKEGTFVIRFYQYPNQMLPNNEHNFPIMDLEKVAFNVYKEFVKSFPNRNIILYDINTRKILKYNKEIPFDNSRKIIFVDVIGLWGKSVVDSIEPIMTFHSGSSFNGFTSSGRYYYGNTMPTTTTTWVPSKEISIIFSISYSIILNKQILLTAGIATNNENDIFKNDWIIKGIEKFKKCGETK